jgi:hypothetical protein
MKLTFAGESVESISEIVMDIFSFKFEKQTALTMISSSMTLLNTDFENLADKNFFAR